MKERILYETSTPKSEKKSDPDHHLTGKKVSFLIFLHPAAIGARSAIISDKNHRNCYGLITLMLILSQDLNAIKIIYHRVKFFNIIILMKP